MQTKNETFLIDKKITRKGKEKERPWRWHKVLSSILSESYKRIGDNGKAVRVKECACWLEFREYQDGVMKLNSANFCQVRICPMCGGRRSKKIFGQVSKIMDYMTVNHEYEYIFLTLTVRNVVGNELSLAIDVLMEAWNKLTKTKEFKKIAKGYFRALEVTKKVDREDYHPHVHVIIAVNKSYFTSNNSGYISQKLWRELWQRCANLDYDPWVDVRKVKEEAKNGDKESVSFAGAVSEVAKYTVKGSQFILEPYKIAKNSGIPTKGKNFEQLKLACQEYTDQAVFILDGALSGRRLVSFGGKMREAHKLLNLEDPTKGDLINTDNEDVLRNDLAYVIRTYRWNVEFMNYVLVDLISDIKIEPASPS